MALYRSPKYQTSLESIGLSIQKIKIDFQDSSCGSHPEFLIGMISAIFALQITQILPTKFPVYCGLLVKKFKIVLQDGSHPGFLIKIILAVFELNSFC